MNKWSKLITLFFTILLTVSLNSVNVYAETPATTTPAVTNTQPAAPANATQEHLQPIGQIVWVKGKVEAVSPDNKSRILTRRGVIYLQDTIKTDKTSTGQIVFIDGGLLSIRADSTIKLSEYSFNKTDHGKDQAVVDIVKGGFRSITGAISKSHPENYKVKTPVATIGVRGTEFNVFYVPEDSKKTQASGLSVGVLKGLVFVKNKNGEVELNPNSDRTYAIVTNQLSAPVISKKIPATLTTTVPIQPATIDPVIVKENSQYIETHPTMKGGSSNEVTAEPGSHEEPATTEGSTETTQPTATETEGDDATTQETTSDSSEATTTDSSNATESGSSSSVDVGSSSTTGTTTEVSAPASNNTTSTGGTSGSFCIK